MTDPAVAAYLGVEAVAPPTVPHAGNGASAPAGPTQQPLAAPEPAEAVLEVEPLLAAATADAAALRSGPCPPQYLAELDAGFERAARAALADPALAERSLRLRRIARRIVPEPLRPAARRLAAEADAAARRWPVLLDVGREFAALADGMANEARALEGPARELLRRADAAARANPRLLAAARHLAALLERSAGSEDLPPLLRRTARLIDQAARRVRAQL